MNWKLILQLSLFGLAMGILTVFVVPSKVEPFFWLVIFLVCAYLIAKKAKQHFLHGLLVGVVNSIWITSAHILLFDQYAATHQAEMEMMKSLPIAPRAMMAMTGPMVGIVSGAVIGVLALIAGKLVKR